MLIAAILVVVLVICVATDIWLVGQLRKRRRTRSVDRDDPDQ